MIMYTTRELVGEEHYKFLLNEFETARHFLRTCGRPTDEYERWLINEARWTARFFGRCLQDKHI